MHNQKFIKEIKSIILQIAPKAEIVLYGSYARGEERPDSDIDLLILIDKDFVTPEDEKSIMYPLFSYEVDNGFLISPKVISRKKWYEQNYFTPFFENISKEGIKL
jgi:uncharacterized protein